MLLSQSAVFTEGQKSQHHPEKVFAQKRTLGPPLELIGQLARARSALSVLRFRSPGQVPLTRAPINAEH